MSTHSKTVILDDYGYPLIAFYRQSDGGFDGHGKELQEFLSGMTIVNGITDLNAKKQANGMDCLAAQIIAHFKKGIGEIYITADTYPNQEYHYSVKRTKNKSKVILTGGNVLTGEKKDFPLYHDFVGKTVTFVYTKLGETARWRTIKVSEDGDTYIAGVETNSGEFKRFLKSRILDGKIIEVK